MEKATFDKAANLALYARVGETANPIDLIFVDGNGDAVPIVGYDFEFHIKRRPTDSSNLVTLTVGARLTLPNSNTLRISPTAENFTRIEEPHFWKLYSAAEDKTWLSGPLFFTKGNSEEIETTEETINVYATGSTVSITVTAGGVNMAGVMRIQGNYDASVNAFPTVGVTTAQILAGYWWKVSVAGTLGGVSLEPGEKIMALVDDPGQTWDDWDLTY